MWAAGYCLRIVVVEENTYCGSSLIHELFSICLEDVVRISKARNLPAVESIVLVGDNTVKELKNRFMLSAAAQLVNHGRLKFPASS